MDTKCRSWERGKDDKKVEEISKKIQELTVRLNELSKRRK
jgi:hypothetical protein